MPAKIFVINLTLWWIILHCLLWYWVKSTDIFIWEKKSFMLCPLNCQLCRKNFFSFVSVTISGSPKIGTKRNYQKPDYCLYCKGRYLSKISAHYLGVHSSEIKVQQIAALPSGCKERKRLLALLQNQGNHEHNCQVIYFAWTQINFRFGLRYFIYSIQSEVNTSP